jgi:hypothetical protein
MRTRLGTAIWSIFEGDGSSHARLTGTGGGSRRPDNFDLTTVTNDRRMYAR